MIVAIRIKGKVDVPREIEETLNRLRLRKKFSCVVLKEKPEIVGMLEKVRDYIAYGKISKEIFAELLKKRGKTKNKNVKMDYEKVAKEIFESKTEKNLEDFGFKPVFFLHPPRGGMKSTKKHFPKGSLGNHGEKIKDLLLRML